MAQKKLKKHDAKIGKRADGTPITKPFYGLTLAEAKQKAETYQTAIGYEKRLVSESEFYVRGWTQKWLLTYKKSSVKENSYYTTYENPCHKHILPFLGDYLMADVTPEIMQEFYNIVQYLSDSMCSKISMCINSIFETAIDNDKCYKNPARHLKLESTAIPKVKEVYDDKQIIVAERWFMHTMPEVVLLLETGARREEMAGWHKTDFDLRRKVYRIQRSITVSPSGKLLYGPPKDNSFRTNPLSPIGAQAVKVLLEKYPNGEYLIGGEFDGHLHPEKWSGKLKTQLERLEKWHPTLPKLTGAHRFRATYGTMLRRHGVDIYTIAKILGHKSVEVTANTYVENELGILRKALKFINKQELIA